MNTLHKRVLAEFRAKYSGLAEVARPSWLSRSRWNPTFCLSRAGDKKIIAVDLIPSANIPRSIYREEVHRLQSEHDDLRVIVCVLDNRLDLFPDTATLCRRLACGLQAFIPAVGLRTVVATDLDRFEKGPARTEPGWFPKRIITRASHLKKLSFRETIHEFCDQVVRVTDEASAQALVYKTIDRLLQYYPECHPNVGTFMKLAHFESMFRQASPSSTEHILHSFRVFLAGCPVIDAFYDKFTGAHNRFCVGSHKTMSVEYCWLLTAIFHDIGKPQERGSVLLETELEDEDLEISVTGKDTRWTKSHWSDARRMLSSLGAFVGSGPTDDDRWDGGTVSEEGGSWLSTEWTELHDKMTSHAVISAFKMLAGIVEQAKAVNERKNRPFVLTHATPAALAILLHDWKIRDQATTWKLFPVDCGIIPMAALLIFIDTWDDFKRTGPISPISIEAFDVTDGGVTVSVRWANAADYEKDKTKYLSFKTAITRPLFDMNIEVAVAGA